MLQAVPTTPLARYRWETTQPDFVADPLQEAAASRLDAQIGRASCRERV